MARKDRVVRRIDERNDSIRTGGGDLIQIGSDAITSPGIIQPPAPVDLTIGTQVLLRTTYTPKVAVNVSWGAPPNLLPEFYLVEYAEDDDFTVNVIRVTTSLNRIALEMKPDTDYWVRVKAMIRGLYSEWGYVDDYPAVSVHTIGDTTPPAAVSGVTANWATGDLILKWTNPSSQNFFQTRVRIYNTFGGTLFKEVFIVGNPGSKSEYRFTVDENNDVTGNNPLTSVYYEILAYSLVGVPAVTSVTGTITKAKPTIPTGLSSTWSGDDGTYDETVTISWNAVTGASIYRVVIDNVVKFVPRTQYTYTYSENIGDHRPTLVSGDYNLTYTVQAMDALNQISGGASGTATNIQPQASNLTLTTVAGFSSLYAYVTPTDEILDLYGYRWTLKSGGVNVRQVTSFTPEVTFTTLNGVYSLEVYAIDKFGRQSTTISGAITLDGLTIEQLRAETQYTNSLGTNPTTLAGLKNDNLVQSVFTVPSGTTWQWTKAERPLLERYHAVTTAVSGAATNMPRVYYGFSTDDTTYTWFSGPLVATGVTGQSTTLTAYANEALAQSNAVLINNINRHDLPTITEARFVKMGHRGNTHHIAEYYPRRMVESDDMRAENIKSINIAAANVLADHISVVNLQAVSAQMGALHMDGIIDITLTGGIYQGTGTFATPTTGLKIYNTSGIGRLTTWSGGVVQVDLDTTGRLKAGAGDVILDSNGVTILSRTVNPYVGPVAAPNAVVWKLSGTTIASFEAFLDQTDATTEVTMLTAGDSTRYGYMRIAKTASHATLSIFADGGTKESLILLNNTTNNDGILYRVNNVNDSHQFGVGAGPDNIKMEILNTLITMDEPLTVTGNITSEAVLVSDITDTATAALANNLILQHRSSNTPAANFGTAISFQNETSNHTLRTAAQIYGEWTVATEGSQQGRIRLIAVDTAGREGLRITANGSATQLGFFGSAGVVKETVTGVRTGTLAQLQTVVANLLQSLEDYGLITDNTT